ncbi:MAG: 4Fe-4S binding protein, partial [Clostridia bacterium]|nr:4Fe-4S binding protein [Clostridia bacterium]
GKKVFKKRYNTFVPQKLHNVLKYLRYVVLIITVYLTFSAARLIFADVDPYYAMYHFFTDEVTIGSLIVLGTVLISSLFIERPWCKYACPYGAVLGLVGKISIFKIKRKAETCNNCTLCDRKCPMNIEISKKKTIGDTHCIRCMDCVEDEGVCSKDSLVYTAKRITPKKVESLNDNGGVK